MSIFGKYIFRSIKKEPLQPLMIIVILSLCVAVMIVSVSLPLGLYLESVNSKGVDEWTADMSVTLKATSDVRFMFEEEIRDAVGDRGEVLGEFPLSGFVFSGKDRKHIDIGVFDLERADKFYEFRFTEYGKITNNNIDRVAILREDLAAQYGCHLGDVITVNILGDKFDFEVQGIVKATGVMLFANMLIDISSVKDELSERSPLIASISSDYNPYTKVHINLNEGYTSEEVKAELSALPSFEDKVVNTKEELLAFDYFTMLLIITVLMPSILLIIVSAMMMLSSFNLLQKKRRADMALFKIVGADSGHLKRLMKYEGLVYSSIGAALGSLISIPILMMLDRLYQFGNAELKFGWLEFVVGFGSSFLFTGICTHTHTKKMIKNNLAEELNNGNLDTDRHFTVKKLVYLIPTAIVGTITALLPPTYRYVTAFLLACLVVMFVYAISPYLIGWMASLISKLLSKKRKGAGNFILSAKACSNSYPLRHAGRIMTILLTIAMSLIFVLDVVEKQLQSSVNFSDFDYAAYQVDKRTRARIDEIDGVIAVADGIMDRSVVIDGGIALNGMSIKGDKDGCFDNDILPDEMPVGDTIILARGIAKMYGFEVGDRIKCTILDIPCELTLTEIVDTHGDFVFYDSDYIGAKKEITCVKTDGSEESEEALLALFDERGIRYTTSEEIFSGTNSSVRRNLLVFKVMLVAMALLTVVGIWNVLSEQRMERKREFDMMVQNGATKSGIVKMQVLEVVYLFVCALLTSMLSSIIVCRMIDMVAVSFGMTLYF